MDEVKEFRRMVESGRKPGFDLEGLDFDDFDPDELKRMFKKMLGFPPPGSARKKT